MKSVDVSMGARLNTTYIFLHGHVEIHRYRYLYFLVMLTAYGLIICCNLSIVWLIVVHKNLHEPMYIFIAALSINSFLFSTNIYPKLLIDFLSDKQVISYENCLLQSFVFYCLGCSEFLLLAIMAYDRYVSICTPLHYPFIMRKTTVAILLVLAWFLPACHVAVPVIQNLNRKLCMFTLNAIFCNNSLNSLFCDSSTNTLEGNSCNNVANSFYCARTRLSSVYGVVVLFNLGLFPMFFILFTYMKILKISYESCGEARKKAAQTCLPHLLILISYAIFLTYDVVIVRVKSDSPEVVHFAVTLQIITYHPLSNPIIYGLKMKEITKHLKRLLCEGKRHKLNTKWNIRR